MRLIEVELSLFLCFLLSACSQRPPMPANKFVDLYVSLQLVSAGNESNASAQKAKADSVMRSFGVSDSLLDSTLSWYVKRPDKWENVLEEANRKLMELKNKQLKQAHQ